MTTGWTVCKECRGDGCPGCYGEGGREDDAPDDTLPCLAVDALAMTALVLGVLALVAVVTGL